MPNRHWLFVAAAAISIVAGASSFAIAQQREGASPAPDGYQIGRYATEGAGSVNTYWIIVPEGVVVVDFQRDTESAARAIQEIRKVNRPVVALLLTHPHPDHIGGLAQFKVAFPTAALYASAGTAAEMQTDSRGYQALTRRVLGSSAPSGYPSVDRILRSGEPITIGGAAVIPLDLGAGEAVDATAFYFPASKALFSGDVAVDGMTDFLLEGNTGPWLVQIDKLEKAFPEAVTLYPGHGAPGAPPTIYTHARNTLQTYREAVRRQIAEGQAPAGELTEAGQQAVEAAVRQRIGDLPPVALIPNLVRENAKAVARELSAR